MDWKKFLDHYQKSIKPIRRVDVSASKLRQFKAMLLNITAQKVHIVPEPPPPNPSVSVYLTLRRAHYKRLFKNNDPTQPPKANLQAWQSAVAAQDYDAPFRRRTVTGASYDAAIFRIKIKVDEAVQMVQWLNANPAVGNKVKDTLRMADPQNNVTGLQAFRAWLNGDPNWTPPITTTTKPRGK